MYKSVLNECVFLLLSFSVKQLSSVEMKNDTNVIILLLGRNIWLFYKEINMFKYNNIYYYAFFLLILNG